MYSRFAGGAGAGAGADRRPPLPPAARPSRDHFPGDPARIGHLENRTLEDEVRRELQIERRARADRSTSHELERLNLFPHSLYESLLPTDFIHRYEDMRYSTHNLDESSLPVHDHGYSERLLSNYKAGVGERNHLDPRFGESVQPPEIRPLEWHLRHHAEVGLAGCPLVSSVPEPILVEEAKPRPKRKFQFRDCDAITLTLVNDPSLNIPGAKRKSNETVVSTATEAIMVAPTNVLRGPSGENSFSTVSTTSKQDLELRFQGNKCLDTSKATDQIHASTSLAEVSSHKAKEVDKLSLANDAKEFDKHLTLMEVPGLKIVQAKEVDKLLPADEAKELDQPPTLKEVPSVKITSGEQQKMLFFCHLCRVNCWDQDGLESHLNGRYHQARLREKGFKKHCEGKKHKTKEERVTVEISLLSDSVSSDNFKAQEGDKPLPFGGAKEVDQPQKAKDVHGKKTSLGKKQFLLFTCHICSVNCLGQAGLDNHLKGRKHKEALRQPKNDKQA